MPNHPDTITLESWRGLNNKVASERLEPNFLTKAENVDIDSAGALRLRKGYTLQITGTNAHSLYSDGNKEAFYVEDQTLYRIDGNDPTKRYALRSGMSDARLSYLTLGSSTYFNNIEGDSGVINGMEVRSWGIDPPRLSPFLTVTTGLLTAGEYAVAIRYRATDGRVSGTGTQQTIILSSDNSGILVSGIAVPPDPSIKAIDVFISTPFGEVLYLSETLAVGKTGTHIRDLRGDMTPLEYQFTNPVIPGELIQLFDGRVYVANGNRIWYSEPHAYEMFNWSNFIEFPSEVTNIMPVDDGFFVTSDMLYFMEGSDPAKMHMREREILTAAKYTGVAIVGGDILMENIPTGLKWLFTSSKGITMVGTGGMVFNLTEREVMVDNAEKGAAIFKSQDGMNQYLSILKDPNSNRVHVGDSATADIIRNGIVIT